MKIKRILYMQGCVSSYTNFITVLANNPWHTFFADLLSIISFIATIYLYYISKKEKCPLFMKKSICIVNDHTKKKDQLQVTENGSEEKDVTLLFFSQFFRITYKEDSVKNLTLTRICFWNSGKEPITRDDVAPKDPLTIKTKNNVQILNVHISTPEYWRNGFETDLSDDLSSLTFTFDYINKNQGAIFDLLHTGTSSQDIDLIGTIIGFGNPLFISDYDITTKQKQFKENSISLLILLTIVIFAIYSMSDKLMAITKVNIPIQFVISFMMFISLMNMIISVKFRPQKRLNKLPTDLGLLFEEM